VDDKKIKPLIERKQAFAERQAARGAGLFTGREPAGTGPENRHGMPKLPVGQHDTKGHWPVLDLGDAPEISRAEWRLEIGGLVDTPRRYGWDDLLSLPQTEDVSDFHCVTGWSLMDNRWGGVRFADLAERAGVQAAARFVLVTAYDVAMASTTTK
jgi:DMSO/TMAO reductase YedYZ molybdopterin-dependent catalytic subunit